MTRTAIYSLQDNALMEQPAMEKEICLLGVYPCTVAGRKRCECHEYNEHVKSLRTIPCSPECRGLWKEGQVLEEDVDYVVGAYPIKAMMSTDPKYMAFPLPVKSEQGEDELYWYAVITLVRETRREAGATDALVKVLKENYSLIKR